MKLVKQAGFAKRYAAVAAATGYRDSEAKQKATPPEVAITSIV